MALYAELDSNNFVLRVVVIDDAHCATEEDGIAWCLSFFGGGIWKQTWLDGSQRVNYADVGGKYDPERNAFLSKQPYPSWTLSEDLKWWNPPTPIPTDANYNWEETTRTWVLDTSQTLNT